MNDYNYKYANLSKYFCLASFLCCIGTLFVQVYVSNTTALKGKDFLEAHNKKVELEKEIAYLQFEDANLSSLSNIKQRASDLGFIEMSEPLARISAPSLASLYSQ